MNNKKSPLIETLEELTFKQWVKDQPWVIFSRTLAEQAWDNRSLIIYDAHAKIAGLLTDIEKLEDKVKELEKEVVMIDEAHEETLDKYIDAKSELDKINTRKAGNSGIPKSKKKKSKNDKAYVKSVTIY